MELSTLRRTAAEILAAAVFELFPHVTLLGGQENSVGFFYDFVFPHPIHPETLPLIEERMRQIIRERRPIRVLEMVVFSARELLKRDGHLERIEELPEEGLVDVIQIGSFHDYSPGLHLKNTAEVAAFKLQEIQEISGKQIRIEGTAHFDKKSLKDFLKKLNGYEQKNPFRKGEQLGLWTQVGAQTVWLERGLQTKRLLLDFLRKTFPQAQEIQASACAERPALYIDFAGQAKKIPIQIREVVVTDDSPEEGQEETQFQFISFFSSSFFEDEMISYLQTIDKTLNILSFRYDLYLLGRKRSEKGLQKFLQSLEKLGRQSTVVLQEEGPTQIEVRVTDCLERSWPVAQIRRIQTKETSWEGLSLHLSVERILLLLLEGYAGVAPFWLAPE